MWALIQRNVGQEIGVSNFESLEVPHSYPDSPHPTHPDLLTSPSNSTSALSLLLPLS